MTTQVQTTNQNTLPAEMPDNVAWGAGQNVRSENILIPKILLMQAISELVVEEKAKMGDFVDSVEKTKIGSHKEPIDLIVFHSFDTWVNHLDGEFFSTDRVTSSNAALAREEKTEAGVITRDYCMNFYCLRPEDIKAGIAFPYVISFKRTSRKIGQTIASRFVKMLRVNKSSASIVLTMSARLEKGDKGQYYVPEIAFGRDTTKEEMTECYQWYKHVLEAEKAGRVDIDESATKGNDKDTVVVNADMGAESRF